MKVVVSYLQQWIIYYSKDNLIILQIFFFAVLYGIFCQNTADKNAKIIREISNISPEGDFNYAFETENQIFVEAQGYLTNERSLVIQGQFQFTSPEGEIVRVVYTADENGFHPQGAHLPTAPPIPETIAKALKLSSTS